METTTNEIFCSLVPVLEMIIIYLNHVMAEIQSLLSVVYPPSYSGLLCCTTKTENLKLELASMSPSTPSSGHSLHSIRPNVTGDRGSWYLPTITRSKLFAIFCITSVVSAPCLTLSSSCFIFWLPFILAHNSSIASFSGIFS